MNPIDLVGLDRDVSRAHAAVSQARVALRDRPEAELVDPLSSFHHVAGRNAYLAIVGYPAGLAEEPLQRGLLRWIRALTHARVSFPTDVAWAREVSAPRGQAYVEPPRATSYREAWREAVLARDEPTRTIWLTAAAELAPALAPISREASGRREEVERRLGPASAEDSAATSLREAARQLLGRTAELRAWLRRTRKERDAPTARLAAWIGDAMAEGATEGWPAHLNARWFEEVLPELSRLVSTPPEVPAAAGGASFARALHGFGRAVREGGRSTLPFSIARSPVWVDSHRFGFLVGALPGQLPFCRSRLDLGARAADRQVRSLRRSALLEAAWVAARYLLVMPGAGPDAWDDVTHDLFGGPVDERLAGAWPRFYDDDSRLEALLGVKALSDALISRFDVDWYANPRGCEWIRERAAGPAHPPSDVGFDLVAAATSLARTFEEALG
jgi:hypothetical protein